MPMTAGVNVLCWIRVIYKRTSYDPVKTRFPFTQYKMPALTQSNDFIITCRENKTNTKQCFIL